MILGGGETGEKLPEFLLNKPLLPPRARKAAAHVAQLIYVCFSTLASAITTLIPALLTRVKTENKPRNASDAASKKTAWTHEELRCFHRADPTERQKLLLAGYATSPPQLQDFWVFTSVCLDLQRWIFLVDVLEET